MEESRIGVAAVIVEDVSSSREVNEVLHRFGKLIVGRMGIPYREKKINIISIAVDAPQDIISAMSGKIGKLDGVSAKTAYSNVVTEI